MKELIKEVILNSEDNSVGFIGDAVEVGNVVLDLMEDGVDFGIDVEELDEMIDDNDILQITKIVCEDCESVHYMVEKIFDEDGYTIPDELETLFVDSDLVDCVNLDVFGDAEIIIVEVDLDEEEFECDGDCENCTLEDSEEDEFDEDLGLALTEELLSSLSEIDPDDVESIVELIADKIDEAFELGYQEGLDDAKAEISDAIDSINDLM